MLYKSIPGQAHPESPVLWMESSALAVKFMNPATAFATKRLPVHLIPAGVKKRGKAAALVAVEATRAKPEKVGMAEEVERELEKEGYLEWRETANCKGCEEKGGILELMECLEREAIMGEDEGKDPTDYNRRAHIFDKSSKIFQHHA